MLLLLWMTSSDEPVGVQHIGCSTECLVLSWALAVLVMMKHIAISAQLSQEIKIFVSSMVVAVRDVGYASREWHFSLRRL